MSALLKAGSEESLEGGERVSSQGIWMKRLQPHGGSEVGAWLTHLGKSKATVVQMESEGQRKRRWDGEVMGLRWCRSTGSHCQNFYCRRSGDLPRHNGQRNDLFLFESLAAVVRTSSWEYHRDDWQVIQTHSPSATVYTCHWMQMVPCPGTRFVTPLNLPYMLRRVGQPEYRMAGWWELLSTPGPSAWLLQKKETTCSLSQQSPTFLAPEMRAWWIVLGWFKHIILLGHFISIVITSAPPQIIRH